MIPLMEDPGGGGWCTVTPLGPWTINIYIYIYISDDASCHTVSRGPIYRTATVAYVNNTVCMTNDPHGT